MKGYLQISWLVSFLLFPNIHIHSQQPYKFHHINTTAGLPSNTVKSIFKDSRGFMWFGTSNGLCRYDGYTIKNFLTDPSDSTSISGNFINSNIIEDFDGNLWIGTLGNGLNKYNRYLGTFTRFTNDRQDKESISHYNVHALHRDKSGIVWIGTGEGLNKLNISTGKFSHFLPNFENSNDASNNILSLYQDTEGIMWVGTAKGVFTFDGEKQLFHLFSLSNRNEVALADKLIYSILEDIHGDIWFGTSWGLYKFDRSIPELIHLLPNEADHNTLSNNHVRHVSEDPLDKDQNIWISTAWGLNKLKLSAGKVVRIYHRPDDPGSIGSNYINCTYTDNSGKLWVATEHAGVSFANQIKSQFNYVHLEATPAGQNGYTATAFLKDFEGNLWVGTREGGLYKYDSDLQLISHFEDDIFDKNDQGFSFIFSLLPLSGEDLLIATVSAGLFRFHTRTGSVEKLSFSKNDSIFYAPIIREIYEDRQGYLWVGTSEGLYFSKKNTPEPFQPIHDSILGVSHIHALHEDGFNGFWVGTIGQGLFYFLRINPEKPEYVQFKNITGDIQSLSNNLVLCIYVDRSKQLWIGTTNGLNRYVTADSSFISYISDDNPAADFIYYMQEDFSGNLWLTTEAGLVRFDPEKRIGNKFRLYTVEDGLPFDNVYPHCFFISEEGRMFIGGNQESGKGFFWFYPDNLRENTQIPQIAVTGFNVLNEAMTLDSTINETRLIKLKYYQDYFSFEFSALNFINSEKNQYAYRLEGLDKDWIFSGTKRFVSYSNIKPGHYVFRVKGSNNDGYWNEKGASIGIVLLPPPWKTWWAYSFYVLFVLGLLFGWRRYDLKRQRLKHQLAIEHMESEKLRELDSLKSRFFANISHEFRTPLTLILGPLEKLKRNVSQENMNDLDMLKRNANRLYNLINQLLDLAKLESGKVKLQVQNMNIVPLIKGYVQSFESLAKQKKIELRFTSSEDTITLYIDRDKIQKMLFNLLSNAFKFTPEGGIIEVSVTDSVSKEDKYDSQSAVGHERVEIRVRDTGKGIAEEKVRHIFDRFYQVDENRNEEQLGTGIGLHLTKELVEIHHGAIKVESKPGEGTSFYIFLPKGRAHLKSDELIDQPEVLAKIELPEPGSVPIETHPDEIEEKNLTMNFTAEDDPGKPTVLIVDDNSDLRFFLRDCLDKDYHIEESINGEKGLEKALKIIPDLIISDVMMPIMDGIMFCSKIKENEYTSHIPVILLTARAMPESKLEGLRTGADDFVTKPFDEQELLVRVSNLIEQRRKLRELYRKEIESPDQSMMFQVPDSNPTMMDKNFLRKAMDVVNRNYTDPEFNVAKFAGEMAVSHMQLHRKLKALTDLSASHFIRSIRLIHAVQHLRDGDGNVKEIAYDVGFNNISYFTKCFKEQFGALPSDYFTKS